MARLAAGCSIAKDGQDLVELMAQVGPLETGHRLQRMDVEYGNYIGSDWRKVLDNTGDIAGFVDIDKKQRVDKRMDTRQETQEQ